MRGAGGLLLSALVAALLGGGAVWWAYRHRLSVRQVVLSGVVTASIALMAAGDLLVPGWGTWWADRPILSAMVTSGLLLGFTVLLVDGVLESRRAGLMRAALTEPVAMLLWVAATGGLATAGSHIAALVRPRQVRRAETRWSQQEGFEPALEGLLTSARVIDERVRELRSDLLAGGTQMHGLYGACWKVGAAARRAQQAVTSLRDGHDPLDDGVLALGTAQWDERIGYVEWLWNEVGRSYNGLAEAVGLMNRQAESAMGDELRKLRGYTVVMPQPIDGFPAPTHMYYLGPSVLAEEGTPASGGQPSG